MIISDRSSMKRERTGNDEIPIGDFNLNSQSKSGPTHTSGYIRCNVKGQETRLQIPASDYEWIIKRVRKGKDVSSLTFRVTGKTAFVVQRPRSSDDWE